VNAALLGIISFLVTLLATRRIISFSVKNGVGIDLPGRRKIHKAPVPRIGGIGILAGFAAALFFLELDQRVLAYLIGSLMIFALGVADDMRGVRWWVKMPATLAATSVTVFYGGMTIEGLGNIAGLGALELGVLSIPFTYFSVLGIVSAINLTDGMNGLAGGTALIALIVLSVFSRLSGDHNLLFICVSLSGCLAAFLFYNFPNGRIFLGDAGSTFLGFTVAIVSIALFQTGQTGQTGPSGMGPGYEPMLPVVVLAVPIFDTVRVMIRRILRGRNPFHADKTHLHHLLLRVGVCDKKIVAFLWFMNLMFGASAIALRNQPGWLLLLFLVNGLAIMGIFIMVLIEARKGKRKKAPVNGAGAAEGAGGGV
jgi:UDP-GlcNAc:undecaprenyl-phosphate GlcNAc-1-phosphate transferase